MILARQLLGLGAFGKFILLLNSVASAFPVAYCGVSERIPNDNIT